ncbi:hypothetical protein GLOIN_2v1806177 [Rhizophagus clarus]|uniref:C2H2-type domain-containing protein n=1 Tax=Rhizophagus clarus TaxID=94130 RepID=A0A8H3KTW2_9GLOM|nr:hypothetical protein GLOIN_2v1806177 [Rhizophagus clarus]GES94040.1 hypothetical protein GLOIN_2v1806177 [Rhizophagus clarus]
MDVIPPPSPLHITNEFKCMVCKKQFKSKCGLSHHKSIVCKYNETTEQEKIPDFLTDKFKEDIVYLIHKHLNKSLKMLKAVLIKLYSRKPRYSYGEVTVEWKQKKDIDAKENVCQGGFMIFHFFVSKKMFCS